MLGAILSRTINGPLSMIPTMVCAALFVVIYRAAVRVSLRHSRVGDFLKGRPDAQTQDGHWGVGAVRRDHVSEPDLDQALRFWGGVSDLRKARIVALERSGRIGAVPRR